MNLLKKVIRFIFRKRIAELKAEQRANNMVNSVKIVARSSSKSQKIVKTNKKESIEELSQKHHQTYLKHLKEFKKANIKKVELICADNCECCKDIKNKEIPISEIRELPMKDCPLDLCRGRYCAVVEFDLS